MPRTLPFTSDRPRRRYLAGYYVGFLYGTNEWLLTRSGHLWTPEAKLKQHQCIWPTWALAVKAARKFWKIETPTFIQSALLETNVKQPGLKRWHPARDEKRWGIKWWGGTT